VGHLILNNWTIDSDIMLPKLDLGHYDKSFMSFGGMKLAAFRWCC